MSETATWSIGRAAATRSANRHWCCTVARFRRLLAAILRPAVYRVVLFDQRGCGRSTPDAGDARTDLSTNTMPHLLADIEQLRTQLNINRWLLLGGSWGSALSLGYAQRHPDRVTARV